MNQLPVITSVQNQRVKDAIKLRDRRGRSRQGRFLIDGMRELAQAMASDVQLQEAFVYQPAEWTDEFDALVARMLEMGAAVSAVSQQVWEKIRFGDRRGGIVAVGTAGVLTAEALATELERAEDCSQQGTSLARPILVLDQVEKPGNIGAVLRTADAAGVFAVALADPRTDLHNPNVIRASLGTVFRVPVFVDSAENLIDLFHQRSLPILVTRVDAELEYFAADLSGRCVVVLGNEAEGVSETWQLSDTVGLRLPMQGGADSLNVATTAAVLLYEALRQRAVGR